MLTAGCGISNKKELTENTKKEKIDLICTEGYELKNDLCEKTEIVDSSINYTCPFGFDLVKEKCQKKIVATVEVSYIDDCTYNEKKTVIDGKTTCTKYLYSRAYKLIYAGAEIMFCEEDDYDLVTEDGVERCRKSENTAPIQKSNYICPSGYTKNEYSCEKMEYKTPTKNHSCDKGTLNDEDNMCHIKVTIPAENKKN